ncbi:MAG: MraY family glycosyltransferase [Candidatus Hadarchaeum sp.]
MGLVSFMFVNNQAYSQMLGIIAGGTLLLGVGILDDCKFLHPQFKLFVAMPLSAIILVSSGVRMTILNELFLLLFPTLPRGGAFMSFCSSFVTVLWVVWITAAFSILDHMDGLCAGIAAIASGFFLTLATFAGQVLVASLAAAMLGTSLGFLFWNFKPAKIFMGDGGAMFLGFMMATLGIKLRLPDMPWTTSWLVPVFILGVPILDTALVTISRVRRGLIPFASPGKDHIAHRLANLDLGQRGAVLALYALGGLFGTLAFLVRRSSVWSAYVLAGAVALAALLAIVGLEYAPYEKQRNSGDKLS